MIPKNVVLPFDKNKQFSSDPLRKHPINPIQIFNSEMHQAIYKIVPTGRVLL